MSQITIVTWTAIVCPKWKGFAKQHGSGLQSKNLQVSVPLRREYLLFYPYLRSVTFHILDPLIAKNPLHWCRDLNRIAQCLSSPWGLNCTGTLLLTSSVPIADPPSSPLDHLALWPFPLDLGFIFELSFHLLASLISLGTRCSVYNPCSDDSFSPPRVLEDVLDFRLRTVLSSSHFGVLLSIPFGSPLEYLLENLLSLHLAPNLKGPKFFHVCNKICHQYPLDNKSKCGLLEVT